MDRFELVTLLEDILEDVLVAAKQPAPSATLA